MRHLNLPAQDGWPIAGWLTCHWRHEAHYRSWLSTPKLKAIGLDPRRCRCNKEESETHLIDLDRVDTDVILNELRRFQLVVTRPSVIQELVTGHGLSLRSLGIFRADLAVADPTSP